ncbi:methionine aminopeptidase 1 [[Candida] railenensis]|uniref:Methionine aminopeptidase n=1 Tax=[Candida] railenensis TaxID=45579 RepID=A0A9P0QMH0_9ASCO|nr:methionine aminopeptidase 1 [[Candida] railenensis]
MTAICAAPTCGKETESTLKCPICLKEGITSVYCDQNCFRSTWSVHKSIHKNEDGTNDPYDPFPTYSYTGGLRAAYPLSARREVPKHIKRPDYAQAGRPISEIKNDRMGKFTILAGKDLEKIRKVGKMSREILDITASHIRPGITTDELDAILHKECVKRNAYPSPLNYYNFPKSFCTSLNEVICHGIPDKTVLKDGDIINLDVTIYYLGFHSDLNETYYVGDKAKCDKDTVNLVETTRESLQLAIDMVKPGLAFRELGNTIEEHATKNGCSVVRTFCGHGTNQLFHCQPNIPHYAKNKAVGIAKPGMVFTIEPMLCIGTYRDVTWPDNWTAVTQDGKYSAQFEQMLLVTEDGCEILTARTETSPGGAIPRIQA